MIFKGERLIITGYADCLAVRLEDFMVEGYRGRFVERIVSYELLENVVEPEEVLRFTIETLRVNLRRDPSAMVSNAPDGGIPGLPDTPPIYELGR